MIESVNNYVQVCFFDFFRNQLNIIRTDRERGLFQRACRSGASCPCPISTVMIPMKENPESTTFELVQWPLLLPDQFATMMVQASVFFPLVSPIHSIFQLPSSPEHYFGLHIFKASTLLQEGYISALTGNLRELPGYWAGMLRDFHDHPVKDVDPELCASIGCTLYGHLVGEQTLSFRCGVGKLLFICSFINVSQVTFLYSPGDEIDTLNDSWMFLLWGSDTNPARTHSPSSRWPICILPASLYAYREGINITLAAVTHAICESFNKLSIEGIMVHDLPSLGGGLESLIDPRKVFIFTLECYEVTPLYLKTSLYL